MMAARQPLPGASVGQPPGQLFGHCLRSDVHTAAIGHAITADRALRGGCDIGHRRSAGRCTAFQHRQYLAPAQGRAGQMEVDRHGTLLQ